MKKITYIALGCMLGFISNGFGINPSFIINNQTGSTINAKLLSKPGTGNCEYLQVIPASQTASIPSLESLNRCNILQLSADSFTRKCYLRDSTAHYTVELFPYAGAQGSTFAVHSDPTIICQ